MEQTLSNPQTLWGRLFVNPRRETLIIFVSGAIVMLAMIGAIGLGLTQQAQFSATARSISETGRVVVQLQRETLRLMALVRQEPDKYDAKAVQLQIDLLKSRFGVVNQPLVRKGIPPTVLAGLEGIEASWSEMQPLIADWQADPSDAAARARLSQALQDMEFTMNATEIEFQRQRVNSLDQVYQTSQQWFFFLGLAALLMVVFVLVISLNFYRVTQQRRAAEAAQAIAIESNRLKSEFLATMSHELRTPLNGVIGYADFLMTAMGGDFNEKELDYLQRILNNGERLLRLVDEILDLSRIEAGRLELFQSSFAPGELLDRVRPELQTLTAKKGLDLQMVVGPDLPAQMVGDPDRLVQIVLNLAGNAIKFTDTGRIEVRLDRTDVDHWTISVSDTGIGIPLHAQEFIFDKFRQVDGSSERKQGGAGLGLAIVSNLALLMKGRVSVESRPGQGSAFKVELPLITPETAGVR